MKMVPHNELIRIGKDIGLLSCASPLAMLLASPFLPLASCFLPLPSCLLPLASCFLPLASCFLLCDMTDTK